MIGKGINKNQRNWSEILPYVVSAYRSSINETTGFSPNRLTFGREIRTPIDLVYGRPPATTTTADKTYSEYVDNLAEQMENAYKTVRENLQRSAERMKYAYDLRVRKAAFKEGDKVWQYSPRRFTGRSVKWQKMLFGSMYGD